VKGEFKVRAENDYDRRRQVIDKDFDNSGYPRPPYIEQRKHSSEDDAPPRPPPPKSVTPSPRQSMSPQFTYSNGLQDRSFSFGKRPPVNDNAKTKNEPEVMDFRTKMKMFNKYQQN